MSSRHDLELAARRILPPFLALAAAVVTLYVPFPAYRLNALAADFHFVYWDATRNLLDGISPYVEPDDPVVAGAAAFVYPAPTALLFAPFGLVPRGLGDVLYTIAIDASAIGTLWALRVRDWRVFAVVFLWPSTFFAWQLGNVTLPLALGLALMYRWRDRAVLAGVCAAFVVGLKLFLWPAVVWLLATRRYAAAGWALAFGVASNLVAWAVIGFDEIPRYLDLLRAISDAGEGRAYTVMALLMNHGVDRTAAYVTGFALAAAALIGSVRLARCGRDADSLTLALVAAVLSSPLVWLHYFCLMMVPLAIARPRLSPVWLLPWLMVFSPAVRPSTLQLFLVLVVAAAVLWTVTRRQETLPAPAGI